MHAIVQGNVKVKTTNTDGIRSGGTVGQKKRKNGEEVKKRGKSPEETRVFP
ncbi:MAG: hypothetical protein HUU08_04900 [Candidatus Brocadia sp.]|nr:hypothetical protein [Candidatus Brocadia sp.]